MEKYKKPILADAKEDRLLLKQGYVVVPFLSVEEVKTLSDYFYENHPNDIPGFYATAHSTNVAFRKKMNEKIREVFNRANAEKFINCTPLGGSFVVKSKVQKERLHPHQDWNIVDEDYYRSFNIWVPLVDLNDENGIIKVMPGSHKWAKTYRGPNIPDPFQPHLEWIWKNMKPLYMKAGEALIYDHRLFHASDPNTTEQLRLAAVYGIIPTEAQMYYYCGSNGAVEMYKSSVQFFMEGDIQKGQDVLEKEREINSGLSKVSKFKFLLNRLGIYN